MALDLTDPSSQSNGLLEETLAGADAFDFSLADLSLTQAVSKSAVLVGDSITFTITLNNSGPANATGVQVQNLLPSGINFTNVTPSIGTYNSDTGIWSVDALASGSNATLTITGTILDAESADAYTNVAEIIAGDQLDPDLIVKDGNLIWSESTSIVAPVVNLDLTKKFTSVKKTFDTDQNGTPDKFVASPGDNVSFEITVTNNGVVDATDVTIEDDLSKILPVGLKVQSLGLDGGINLDTADGGDGDAQTVEVKFNTIAPGASKTITVNAKVSDDYITPINFSATLGFSNPSSTGVNTALPEYFETRADGTFFVNYNVKKEAGNKDANFGFLDVTNAAEVVAANGISLNPGSVTASARLDVATYEINASLNNGEKFFSFGVNLDDPNNPNLLSFFLSPNPGGGTRTSGDAGNHSAFLAPGTRGLFDFLTSFVKSNNPQYLADLAAWMDLSSDGDLSNTQDEKAIFDALADFVKDGVFRSDRYDSGSFTLNNRTQTQNLNIDRLELAPKATKSVNVLVNDRGAFVSNGNGIQIGSFANLQAALDSFCFADPTDVNVTIQDSSGDGAVQTRLQELGGFDFDKNWSVKNITVSSNVSQLNFTSGNSGADIDLSLPNLAILGATPAFNLRGDNAKDDIIGTRFADNIQGANGNDVLSGLGGNDTINGGNGKDTISGGRGDDSLTGGLANDTFVFGAIFGNDIISDFSAQDKLDFSQLGISKSALDSNGDGIINAIDNLADLLGNSLKLDLTSLSGGTISLTGVTSVSMGAVIL